MSEQDQPLKKTLGIWDILMFGVGGIVGAGIYAIVGEAAGLAGNLLWASFLLAAVVALLTGLTYAEFVSRYPDAGGSFEYVQKSFGRKTALWLSLIMLLTGVVAPAAIAISFSDYLGRLLEVPQWMTTLGIILLMGGVNVVGIQQSSWFNTLATVVTLLGLGLVVGFSVPNWGEVDLLSVGEGGYLGIFTGGALIFFSYVGFEDLVKIAEETKEPEKTMPRGIILSGIIVLVIYLLIAVSAVSTLGARELAESKGPLAQVMATAAGSSWVTVLIVVALFATSKTILTNIMGSSRLLYDVARDGDINWMKNLTRVHQVTKSPIYAIGAITVLVIGFALIGNLKLVASVSNIFVFLLFIIVNIALLVHRRKEKEPAPFRSPINVNNTPVLSIVAILGLVLLLGFNVYNLF